MSSHGVKKWFSCLICQIWNGFVICYGKTDPTHLDAVSISSKITVFCFHIFFCLWALIHQWKVWWLLVWGLAPTLGLRNSWGDPILVKRFCVLCLFQGKPFNFLSRGLKSWEITIQGLFCELLVAEILNNEIVKHKIVTAMISLTDSN